MTKFKSEFLNIMQERGFYNQCTNEEGFDTYLYECENKGKPAIGYLGSDPTGDSLHVGHIVPLMMLRWFQKCGHKTAFFLTLPPDKFNILYTGGG